MGTIYRKLSWTEIESAIDDIASKIERYCDDNNLDLPDKIIGISRGGLIPAVLLSDKLNIRDVQTLQAKSYSGIFDKDKGDVIVKHNTPIDGKFWIVIDDIYDSGDTINAVMSSLTNNNTTNLNKEILTATLCKRVDTKLKPTFHSEEIDHDVWLIFPWEREEFKGD
tara:strand:- start:808 stop:1308 length:501 start_codon:yes stop_codon:yes gene_type:complete